MLKTIAMLSDELNRFSNPAAKVKRLVNSGDLTPIVRGLYETDKNTPGYCLAASIYGPSYLSFEFALAYYSLIPEAVYTFTCASFEKKKVKEYDTPFGRFTYRDVPSSVFPYGLKLRTEDGYSIIMATPEKALCDLLYTISPRSNQKELLKLLHDDLRIDDSEFQKLNMHDLSDLASLYHTCNHKLFVSLIKKYQRNQQNNLPRRQKQNG